MSTAHRTPAIADIVIEREFGKDNLLDLYSAYVSKKILEILKSDDESEKQQPQVLMEQT